MTQWTLGEGEVQADRLRTWKIRSQEGVHKERHVRVERKEAYFFCLLIIFLIIIMKSIIKTGFKSETYQRQLVRRGLPSSDICMKAVANSKSSDTPSQCVVCIASLSLEILP